MALAGAITRGMPRSCLSDMRQNCAMRRKSSGCRRLSRQRLWAFVREPVTFAPRRSDPTHHWPATATNGEPFTVGRVFRFLTSLGSTFAERWRLRVVELGELTTHSLEDCEAFALRLPRDRALALLHKAKLARRRTTYWLFNSPRFTRHIESVYL